MDKKIIHRTAVQMSTRERVGSAILFFSMVALMAAIVVGAATDGQPTTLSIIEGMAFGVFIIVGLVMLVKA